MAKRDLIFNNFWWKLTALMLAFASWIGVKTLDSDRLLIMPDVGAFSSRELVSHPITITKPATDQREYLIQPTTVDITLIGDLKALRSLDTREVRATVEVADLRGETNTLPIKVLLPQLEGVRMEKYGPQKAQVEVIKTESKAASSLQ